MYQDDGSLFWERELNANGKVIKETQQGSCPFLFQGQYYDAEIELAYNRFRYYDPEDGRYISQDPIGLASGEPNFYAYVADTNTDVDIFGLECGKARKVKIGEEIAPNTTVKRIRQGTNGKAIVIGRGMDGRVIPGAKNINAEYWKGFDSSLSESINLSNNRKWLEEKISEGYTVIDVGLDPKYVRAGGIGSLTKGKFYSMETQVAFGKKW